MSPDFESLVQQYLDGRISGGDLERLNAELGRSADARRAFVEWLNMDSTVGASAAGWDPAGGLESHRAGDVPSPPESSEPEETGGRRSILKWLVPLAAAASFTVLFSTLPHALWRNHPSAFATVVNDAGVEELSSGTGLNGEAHILRGGNVELVTALGARVVIEAPAEFRFESAQRLRMTRGRLSAEVPPAAKGFTVLTPSGEAVDLGTRFGVDVPVGGNSEIHVFQGEVIAKASGDSATQSLRSGDAVTLEAGKSTARELRSGAFIQAEEVQGLRAGLEAGQRARSEAALAGLRRDPALIALLDFESGETHPGIYRSVQGRWPGSRASEFIHEGDHLKLDAGGEHEWPHLTLAAWVRLDQLGAPFQSLLHTDGWDASKPGQVHWMVTRQSVQRLALFGNRLVHHDPVWDQPDSRSSFLSERGRWIHLVAIYDAPGKAARFYLNGRFDNEAGLTVAQPARLGPSRIGNWDLKDRTLSGRVDELAVLGRVLSPTEIQALFESGNPYR